MIGQYKQVQYHHHILLYIIILLAMTLPSRVLSQRYGPNDTMRVYAYITPQGDTIPMSILEPVFVYTTLRGKWAQINQQWDQLRAAIYITYPYAVAAGKIINEINMQLQGVTDGSERRDIIRSREKDLKREFTSKLKALTIYQGQILMKLINRQTGNNCYEIIQEYKGSISAIFWQMIARLFGSSLKQPYNPNGADANMETIVKQVARMYGY